MLKVLTLNIWNRQGPWERRLELIQRGIRELEPDVVGLQEVLSDGRHSLAHEIATGSATAFEVAFGSAKALPGGISLGNAVLSRFPITASEVVALPSGDTEEERSLLVTELATDTGTLPFLVTHLAWRFHHGYLREQQALRIGRHIASAQPVRDDRLPLVLVGDFNARPEASEVRFLCGLQSLDGTSIYLADCFDEVGEGRGYTYDARHNPYAAITREAPRRIDYVFVRGPDRHGRGKPLAARVVLDRVEDDGTAPSDHYGVYAEIAL
jgi:endonuclease/exonuclease/phosphatase family metal-dependent hydrolase